jgi:N-acetyl-gamma-glutamylphosphate reductase
MTKSSVLLVGATGETGKQILEALVDDNSFVGIFLSSARRKGQF